MHILARSTCAHKQETAKARKEGEARCESALLPRSSKRSATIKVRVYTVRSLRRDKRDVGKYRSNVGISLRRNIYRPRPFYFGNARLPYESCRLPHILDRPRPQGFRAGGQLTVDYSAEVNPQSTAERKSDKKAEMAQSRSARENFFF